MKTLIALAGAFALAACGGSEPEEPIGPDIAEAPVAEAELQYAGVYEGEDENGVPWRTELNEDGTFTDMEGGEVIRTGTWSEEDIRGTCFVEEGVEGEDCYQMGEVQEDGTVEVTGPDGASFTMNKTS
ncbi:hypothetical protein [Aurantiacibacter aquimixticola]|uniref:Uncharacterized protein n=1 Tax=Aurantiacibacter aquimixticola TaxID=1958945 RepID=A0A419RS30_9SPHN|nr:hypothetical protein [Aurantiacibacter aquimixticola]RJY08585.1 hypothetical protein D6201_03705 [Aurantiacibacter aquimixticola]